jgi:hypothetical protein
MENADNFYPKLIHINIWGFLGYVPGLKLSTANPNKAWAWLGFASWPFI